MTFQASNDGFEIRDDCGVILKHSPEAPMLYAGFGRETIDMYRGNYAIEDYVSARLPLFITDIDVSATRLIVNFDNLVTADITLGLHDLNIHFSSDGEVVNRYWLRLPAEADEHIYGCGEQMSYFDLRGRHFPLWTSEPGVGRDKTTYVTWRSDVENKAGGDYYNTNYPEQTFISSRHYYLHSDSTAYADFDFRHEDFHELQFWAVLENIYIETAPTYIGLLEKLTARLGRQRELPEWIYNGLIIGAQGGERSFDIMEKTLAAGIPVAGLWCQDWCGKRETSFGKRLQWDWRYNKEMYPELPQRIEKLHRRGIKFLGYINPYLVNDGELYREGKEKGYFATKYDGSDYLVDFGEFYCGVVDLTNPDAFEWFKNIIIKYMIDIGIDGWMADFGEYLPTDDIDLYNSVDPMIEHNKWPVRWAECNYRALEETDNFGNIVYFMRAGGSGSQKYCTLLWAGDQSVDLSRHDGLITVVCAALSSGMSGFGLNHCDIGGYTSLFDNVRTKEVFLRWAELAAFMPVMRTHEGNRPDTNFQYYDDDDTMQRLARLVRIYTELAPYTRELVSENARCGTPVMRPMFLHYEDAPEAYAEDMQYQYMYGSELVVAPVYTEGASERGLWLPEGEWEHFWSGKIYNGGRVTVAAPLGEIPVFIKRDGAHYALLSEIAKKAREEK